MIVRKILVIDDDGNQAKALAMTLEAVIPNSKVTYVSKEEDITAAVENNFYNLAVLDIRMDDYETDGIKIANRIIEVNPFAKILFVSKFIPEYIMELQPLLTQGNVLGFSDKNHDYDAWGKELAEKILPYYEELDRNPSVMSESLVNFYSDVKDEKNAYQRGVRFENFVAMLFNYIGFNSITSRVRDDSSNETDLVIRNDIDDPFLSKFGKYIMVECKNHIADIGKNDFILFKSKVDNSNGLVELGFLITSSSFKKTVPLESLRSSMGKRKIILIDNADIMRLIKADDQLEMLKKIIDSQVKSVG